MTDILLDRDTADLVHVYEPADVIVQVLGTNAVAKLVELSTVDVIYSVTDPTTVGVLEIVTPGPQGVQGEVGEQGETGETGPSPMYEQSFATPEMVWVVNHPLNTKPVVTTVDQNGAEIIGDVSFPDNATVIIAFGLPFAGIARLKA